MRLLVLIVLAAGCHPQDIDPLEQQPKFKAYSENEFFSDGRAMRTPPENTIPRERVLDEGPPPVDADLVALGRWRYDAICATCHGLVGDGDSIVGGKMGLRAPPSLQTEGLRAKPAGEIYRVISDGYGLMPRYSITLSPRERWAVIAYVRALQLSQNLPVADAPPDVLKGIQ
jgi:mono/diheme cytochrome c family protein